MAFTITIGWWLVPAAVTLAAFVWAWVNTPSGPDHGYAAICNGMIGAAYFGSGCVISLAAWLIWSLLQ